MSLAYLDPGNLEADLQQGAYTNLQLVWVLWWSTCIGLVLQEMAARLGCVTGQDLAQVARAHYAPWQSIVLYVNMEIAIIGSDIQEVIGSAIAMKLLFGLPLYAGCLVTGLDTFTFLAVHYLGVRYLEALICALIGTMAVCFFVVWADAGTDLGLLASGWVVPMMPGYAIQQAVGTVGAVIMPHNLYLHSGLVLSRKLDRTDGAAVSDANRYNLIESSAALLCSFFINLAVVAAFAAYFFDPGCAAQGLACLPCADVNGDGSSCSSSHGDVCSSGSGDAEQLATCDAIGLERAGDALQRAAPNGQLALVIWGVGLLAAGQAATMTATFAGQIVMDGFLDIKLPQWQRVLLTRAAALGPALAVSVATGSNTALFNNINEWLNVLQSIQLPFAMLPVLKLTCMASVMGEDFRTQGKQAGLVASLAGLVLFINFYLLGSFLADSAAPVPHAAWFYALCAAWGVAYLAFLLSLVWAEACALAAAVREWCRPVVAASSEEADSAALDCANPLHPPTFLLVTGS
jgi:natural resistance-associated macrophage protein